MTVVSWLTEPLGYSFIVRALMAAVLVGIVCSVLGTYVILRGMAFFGDALAHTILPGIVVAFLFGWPLALGALAMGILTAVGIGAMSNQGMVKEDTAIGVIFAGAFALGVALLSATGNYTVDLAHFLFGNLLGVSAADLWVSAGLGGVVLLIIFLLYREFLVISFDPILATTLRLPTRLLNYLMLILIAITIVVALQVVGIALMMAMLVTPAAAASLLTRRLPPMMLIAAVIGVTSSVAGLYASFYLDIASGPAIVLVATLIFMLAFLFAPGRGLLRR
ncbi:MAG: metal ABC transporter permease [Anaerolineae bacterium]